MQDHLEKMLADEQSATGELAEELRPIILNVLGAGQKLATARKNLEGRSVEPSRNVQSDLSMASSALSMAVSALFAAHDFKCNLKEPPTDLKTRPTGPGGAMVTICGHKPPHCWDGQGSPVDCD